MVSQGSHNQSVCTHWRSCCKIDRLLTRKHVRYSCKATQQDSWQCRHHNVLQHVDQAFGHMHCDCMSPGC